MAAENDRDSELSGPGESQGDRIGRYTLIEELGEGGMGTVWLAKQSEPVVREVALKIIKAGMDTREVIARFEAERQALALMDHPWIAKVLDGGATAGGRPYFVMEHVRGAPIHEHCDAFRLVTKARLELFMMVCEAVQHAHQKGIIHRDIKPSNVMVSDVDGEPAPKVIDFGIAKATSANLQQQTLLTQHAQVLGTPEYMAPEQAALGGVDVDTRADVYALGMLLYELLTGCKPFDLGGVLASGYDELLRTIREVEPPRPSTRVKNDETGSEIAARRQVDPDTLVQGLRGDLDWIVMKAVEKERSRRYASASELAADIQRYLDHEPVTAAPPSTRYRLKKLVQRRKKTVLAAAAALFLIVAGTIGTSVGLWRARVANAALDLSLVEEQRQRELAQENERRARDAKARAEEEAQRATLAENDARERAQELTQVVEFEYDRLRKLDPQQMGIWLREALLEQLPVAEREAAAASLESVNFTSLALDSLERNLFGDTLEAIEASFEDQPLVRSRLQQAMARTLRLLGLLEAAREPQARALAGFRELLGDDHRDTLEAVGSAASLQAQLGNAAASEALCREALSASRRLMGDEHPFTLNFIGSLGATLALQGRFSETEVYYREGLETSRRVFGDDGLKTLLAQNDMAGLLRDLARYEESAELYEDTLERMRRTLDPDDLDTANALMSASILYRRWGRPGDLDRAEELAREALEMHSRVLGKEHPLTLECMYLLATALGKLGRNEEAELLSRETLEIKRRTLGEDHPQTLVSLADLAVSLQAQGQADKAEPYFYEAAARRRRVLGADNLSTLTSIGNLGACLASQGRSTEAEPCFHEAAAGRRRLLGADHSRTTYIEGRLQSVLHDLIDAARSEGDDQRLGHLLAHSGAFELERANLMHAESQLAEANQLLSALLPEADVRLWRLRNDLGAVLAASTDSTDVNRHEEADLLLSESADWLLDSTDLALLPPGPNDCPVVPSVTDLIERTADVYDAFELAHPGEGFGAAAKRLRARLAARGD